MLDEQGFYLIRLRAVRGCQIIREDLGLRRRKVHSFKKFSKELLCGRDQRRVEGRRDRHRPCLKAVRSEQLQGLADVIARPRDNALQRRVDIRQHHAARVLQEFAYVLRRGLYSRHSTEILACSGLYDRPAPCLRYPVQALLAEYLCNAERNVLAVAMTGDNIGEEPHLFKYLEYAVRGRADSRLRKVGT